jgi:hypothetical protein
LVMSLADFSDARLFGALDTLVGTHRECTADIVAHLAELDARRAYLARGYGSLFQYCLDALRLSDDETCRRIEAARLVQGFPVILEWLASGRVTLSSLALLKPHLTAANHAELLAGIEGLSCRLAKEWLAARFPVADVPERVRQLPQMPAASTVRVAPVEPQVGASEEADHSLLRTQLGVALPARPARVEPLSTDRFAMQVTISRSLKGEIDVVRDLMRHQNPTGSLETILEHAIAALKAKLEKQKLGSVRGRSKREWSGESSAATSALPQNGFTVLPGAPPSSAEAASGARSAAAANGVAQHANGTLSRDGAKAPTSALRSHISPATKRAIVAKHGWQCSFVGVDGRRCESRAFLQFDHICPKGIDGTGAEDNVRILCRAHNQYAAERIYGAAVMQRARVKRRQEARGRRVGE